MRHNKPKPNASLGTLETLFWTGSWIFGVGYSVFHVLEASSRHTYKLALTDLEPGWIPGRHMDVSDSEWIVFSEVLLHSFPWLLLHLIGCQLLKKRGQTSLLLCYNILLPLVYLFKSLGSLGTLYILLQPGAFFLISMLPHRSFSPMLFWCLGIWFITGFQWLWPTRILVEFLVGSMPHVTHYIMNVTMCWINARCISYSLDIAWGHCARRASIFEELLYFLAYCLYFPLCIGGPIITYKSFADGIQSSYRPWNQERTLKFIFQILYYGFWLLICHLTLHFLYFSAIQFEPDIMNSLNLWTLAGIGYSMGQFFHMKYVVFYGFPRPFALADGILDIPQHPQCIARIHLYSNMWRNFDRGLYLFLQRYIYRPILGERRDLFSKLIASAISFGFIFIWHGVMEHILLWSFLNFVGITVESLARSIYRTEAYQLFESRWLHPRCRRRMHALLSSPLFLVSLISNFYFFMGKSNGDLYFYRVVTSWPVGIVTILFFMYSGAQTSLEVSNWEHQKVIARNS